ncbi:hypothetical protein TIFTF001_008110 [Ficus carica]|uniref:Uncharacterized protein n=1 Tax=Ficus carica TaxID=3494 RepID=A0AA87ZU99_FICCA|nr:hypothetical protein TIFTF001_008110 [Ficus carica]
MYVTRPLSLLRRSPELLTSQPQDHHGPNSGYLVLFDDECETTTCFGACKDTEIRGLPFPQNKDLTIREDDDDDYVVFIPVLDQPLSSHQYYINHKKDRGFTAVSVVEDGLPPLFLRRKYWQVFMESPRHYQLFEAPGLISSLRARLPELNFSPSNSSSETVAVGRWYCPFVFVKEVFGKLKEQMKKSMFYEVKLEQRWEKIYGCENGENSDGKVVYVDVLVEREKASADEEEAVCDWGHVDNGVIWFRRAKNGGGGDSRLLGLSVLVAERMRWEQERVG